MDIHQNQQISKKLVNDPKNSVQESLEGFVLTHAHVKLLKGHNVVVRSDLESFKKEGKVSLVTGGGSGHEPAHIGYIGKGMLTGAVCGDIFTSPSSSAILTTIRTCATTAGVLLIVKNYTGDRLNFGKALEIATGEGINVAMVIVDEDCALTSNDRSAGRRGLCGTILIHKIAGAMAEEGRSLMEIKTYVDETVKQMGTISVSLTPCSIPGKPVNFTIPENMIEFGLGIHGEAGVRQIELSSAQDVVGVMMNHLLKSPFMPNVKGNSVAVIINNLGGTSNLELTIIAKEAINFLEKHDVQVDRCFVGTYVTSMEMAGVSITVMILHHQDILRYFEATSETSAWVSNGLINTSNDMFLPAVTKPEEDQVYDVTATGDGIHLLGGTRAISNTLLSNEEMLNELDRQTGDGDTGATLTRGVKAILSHLSDDYHLKLPVNSTKKYFMEISKLVESAMGGSSGALLSVLLTTFSSKFSDDENLNETQKYINAFQAGVDAMKRYGGAVEGDKTMLDSLYPCVRSLTESLENGTSSVKEIIEKAAKAARVGAESTSSMQAKSGRASYVSNITSSRPDPGAVAVALAFEALSYYFDSSI